MRRIALDADTWARFHGLQPLPVVENFPVFLKGRICLTVAMGHGLSGSGTLSAVLFPKAKHDGRHFPVRKPKSVKVCRHGNPCFFFFDNLPDGSVAFAADPFPHPRKIQFGAKRLETKRAHISLF